MATVRSSVKLRRLIILFAMQPGAKMTDDLDTRRRRASYRAHHRGTKEMDVLIGRYADARLGTFSSDELTHFETFLNLPDPMLQAWVFTGSRADAQFQDLVTDIRIFHQLATQAD